MTRPARVNYNLDAARTNLKRVRELTPGKRVIAIIKADAYGHGLVRMAAALSEADAFGVACLEEAQCLRNAGIHNPIILLEGPFAIDEVDELQRLSLDTVVHHHEQIGMLSSLRTYAPVRVWIKIDTGMHRLGFAPADLPYAWNGLNANPGVAKPLRLMTHLACAHEHGHASVVEQLTQFAGAAAGYDSDRSVANSAAILAWPEAHADWVRPGIMLYGVSPFRESTGRTFGLQPVMSLTSALIAVKPVRAGDFVGYGSEWQCPEDMLIGIVAMGYGDGFPRHATAGTPVIVNGRRCALIGKVAMDMLTVDLRACPDARVGDPVILWGEELPVEEVARYANTIPYELLCGVRARGRFPE